MAKKGKGFKFDADVIGKKELARKMRKLGKDAPFELGKSLYKEAETIMATSKAVWVPVDKGPLRASGHVQFPKPGPLVEMGFGGPSAPYALYVHEDPKPHHPVGSYKYLEMPLMEALPGMPKRLAISLNAWLVRNAVR